MAWEVQTPAGTFQYIDGIGYNRLVFDLLEVEYGRTGVPYLHTATFDFDPRDERTVYLAATVWAEDRFPGEWQAAWTDTEPLPSLPDYEGDRLPVN